MFKLSDLVSTSSNTAGKSHALLKGQGYLEEAYADVDLPVEIMPDVKPIGSVIRYTNDEAAKLDFPRGTPIVNGVYLAGGFTNAGTIPFDRFSRNLGMSIDELTSAVSSIPAGSDGLISCTEWYGVRAPETYPQLEGFLVRMSEKNMT
ncbi:MAG: hypothetical protein ACUVQ8_04380 [Nitrososphaeria archaeon]